MARAGFGLLLGVFLSATWGCESGDPAADAATAPAESADEGTALSGNAGCLVCHMTFLKEPLSVGHLEAKIPCTGCHGPSAAHANDENVGATPPDIRIQTAGVDTFCRTCHKLPRNHPEKIILGVVHRKGPEPGQVCTDCHGKHRIDESAACGLDPRARSMGNRRGARQGRGAL